MVFINVKFDPYISFSSISLLQLSSGKAGVLAARILVHCRSQLSSDEEVATLWSNASLEWSALGVASEDLGEFLSTHVSHETHTTLYIPGLDLNTNSLLYSRKLWQGF